jgi:hypothetical protein
VGVATHHWTVFIVLLLYWSENVVVGVFNVLRMASADPQETILWAGKLFIIPFFMVHYGMFTFVHGMFILALFGGPQANTAHAMSAAGLVHAVRGAGIGYAILFLFLSHGFSFFHNYIGSGEYRRVNLMQLMAQPYGRIVVLHLTTLLGGFAASAAGQPLYALVVLVFLKTGLDLRAHLAERAKLAESAAPPGAVAS